MFVSFVDYLFNALAPYAEYSGPRLMLSALHAPTPHIYFEILLISGIIWLLFQRSYRIKDVVKLTDEEKSQLIKDWQPEPLVPRTSLPDSINRPIKFESISTIGKYVQINEKSIRHLNLSSFNLLNFNDDSSLKNIAKRSIQKYGIGSCGPRGFYGTFDAHLNFERDMEKFLNVEEVILYSYGFSTMASAIPSYAKKKDVIFADELVNQAIYQGLIASRSNIKFFKHNDLDDLERLLIQQSEEDIKDPKKANSTRRFLLVEGLYHDTGNICNLKKIVELKYKYKVRLFIDESLSIGVIGKTGRGLTEYFDVPTKHIDLISGSLETAFANYGGFCAGSKYVIDHQRLSGSGYCFSASSPPMLAVAMCETLRILNNENGSRQKSLKLVANSVSDYFDKKSNLWVVGGDRDSPVKYFRLLPKSKNTFENLEKIVTMAFESQSHPLLLTTAKMIPNSKYKQSEPSIRVVLNCSLTEDELNSSINLLESLANSLT